MPDRPPSAPDSASPPAPKRRRRLRHATLWAGLGLLGLVGAYWGFYVAYFTYLNNHVCTLAAASEGVSVRVDATLVTQVTDATMIACWDGTCRPYPLELRGMREWVDSVDGPLDTRPVSPRPNFVEIRDLPTTPVVVNLVFRDRQGNTLFNERTTVTPELMYPNGPRCGGGGPQAQVVVHADGSLTT